MRGWWLISAAAARVVCGAAGSRVTQPVTAAPMATRSSAAAVSGTRIASGLPGSANGADGGAASALDQLMSAATEATVERTSSSTAASSASSASSTTSRPSEPSTCALATPGILRTGSSTAGAYSCQRGKGSSGSRSRCTRRPLCQRTGGTIAGAPSAEPSNPMARPVVCAIDWITGPASSATGLANVCRAPAAPAAVDTPARTTCAAPPATPATTLETPGIFTRHPSITSPRSMILTCAGAVHTWVGKVNRATTPLATQVGLSRQAASWRKRGKPLRCNHVLGQRLPG
ncbi:hypothetical protein PICSAR164_00308 [Mycobacterium avium subsp. paratuberculosis]|nr:hypothetical protein PICSAR164_00308 [Mycobacterium avium subsp. paratuberculosis]